MSTNTRRVSLLLVFALSVLSVLSACADGTDGGSGDGEAPARTDNPPSAYAEARQTFETVITDPIQGGYPPDAPPAGLFDLVTYPSKVGDLHAYVSPDPGDGQRHPAFIWVTGGWDSSIDSYFWEPAEKYNDQTGSSFSLYGNLLMIPSFRGANDNPGTMETLYGEVDDIMAAADYLGALPYVDADRIYLVGHSTGGTLVLLAAAASDQFKAVISFGPVSRISDYGADSYNFDKTHADEEKMRSPILWLSDIHCEAYVIEGVYSPNVLRLREMRKSAKNKNMRFIEIDGASHFTYLYSACRLISQTVRDSDGGALNLTQKAVYDAYSS